MGPQIPYVLVQVSVDNAEHARSMARVIVQEKLAACAQILPIQSCYEWQGNIAEEDEYLILFKTRADVYEALEARIRALHTYEVPEILALPIVAGTEAYLKWMDEVIAR